MSFESDSLCQPQENTGVFFINGTADNSRPYNGINDYYLSIESALLFWSNHHGSDSTIIENFMDNNNNNIEHYEYLNLNGQSYLEHYKIINGGHDWFELSVNDKNIDQAIWQFFSNISDNQ